MTISFEDLTAGLRVITIAGRLDIQGTQEIDIKFTALSCADNRKVVVDLTQVSFLASIGIRSLITNAKALKSRGGRMVLFVGENAGVIRTLQETGIDVILPLFTEMNEATAAAVAG